MAHPTDIAADEQPLNAAALRDAYGQLTAYLDALDERDRQIAAWIKPFEYLVAQGYHWIDFALEHKSQDVAVDMVKALGDAAGLVLFLGDFAKRAEEVFGPRSRLAEEIAMRRTSLPDLLLYEIPLPAVPDITFALPSSSDVPPQPAPPAIAQKDKKWWNPGSWFGGDAVAVPDAAAIAAFEAEKEQRAARAAFGVLQGERFYYIDSFMDWVGDTLTGEGGGFTDTAAAHTANPLRIAERARDEQRRNTARALGQLENRVREYHAVARLFDMQDIPAFAVELRKLFKAGNDEDAQRLRNWLLSSYGVASFTELATERVRDPDHAVLLTRTALELEPTLAFSYARNMRDIKARLVKRREDKEFPLPWEARRMVEDRISRLEAAGRAQNRQQRGDDYISLSDLFGRALRELEDFLSARNRGDNARPPSPAAPRRPTQPVPPPSRPPHRHYPRW